MKTVSTILLIFTMLISTSLAADKPPRTASEADVKRVEEALPSKAPAAPAKARKILIFSLCEGFNHSVIPLSAKAFELMGKKTGAFETVESFDKTVFDPAKLAEFDAVLLNNTTNIKLNDAQKKALLDFVKVDGKGLIGTHAASDNFGDWAEGAAMMGGMFDGHPWGGGGTWAVKIDDPGHPINKGFEGKGFKIKDEIYQIKGAYSRDTHRVLLSLDMSDEANVAAKGQKREDKDNAIAWIYDYGKGRVFYCSLGHNNDVYWNTGVLQHYLAGIQFALGDLKADTIPSAKLKK